MGGGKSHWGRGITLGVGNALLAAGAGRRVEEARVVEGEPSNISRGYYSSRMARERLQAYFVLAQIAFYLCAALEN